jgi:hypothetical protein
MPLDLLKVKLSIEEKNELLRIKVEKVSFAVMRVRQNEKRTELIFKARCLERLYVLGKIATDNCITGYPVAASLLARGAVETAGLLVLFESRMKKASNCTARERMDIVRRFVFSTKKFGSDQKAVHALDCVRALKPFQADVELLYDLLCEAVHPNWLGVSQFGEFGAIGENSREQDDWVTVAVFNALSLGHKAALSIAVGEAQE